MRQGARAYRSGILPQKFYHKISPENSLSVFFMASFFLNSNFQKRSRDISYYLVIVFNQKTGIPGTFPWLNKIEDLSFRPYNNL
jgi:hypothetical protein